MRLLTRILPILLASPLLAQPKTDVVIVDNGNQLTCEIVKLERGKLTVKTDAFGTITVKWTHVLGIRTDFPFQLELQSGARYVGPVKPLESGKIEIGIDETAVVDTFLVVEMIPIESSVLSRVKGSVDAGYDFTQATSATNWAASAEIEYRTPRSSSTSM